MRKLAGCVLSTALAVFPSAACVAQGVNLTVGGGVGDLNVDTRTAISNGISTDDSFVPEIGVGYRFANNVAIEGSTATTFELVAFFLGGSYDFHETRLMAGYAFPVTEKLRFVPALGVSVWDLEAVDGLFSFVPAAQPSRSGTDTAWRLAGEYYFSRRFGAYFSYYGTRPDFGSFSALSFGMKVQF
jgi:Domain of unknown function (DUF2715)